MSVELLYPLEVRLLPNGRWLLLADLVLEIEGRLCRIPEGFDTDFSSWPWFSPRPKASRMAVAGVVHDWIWRHATLGADGDPVGFAEGNRIWRLLARAGEEPEARATAIGAGVGWLGLWAGGWWSWLRYRRAGTSAARG